MVSTNAGGVMAFRNGVMRHRVLGLEAVLPDGTVLNDLTRVVKTTAGYDVKHLFIGAEGTLGIITRVAIKLDPTPKATATAMLALPSVSVALDVVNRAMRLGRGQLRAAEVLWRRYLELTAGASGWKDPALDTSQPVYLLLGVGGERHDEVQEELLEVLAAVSRSIPGVSAILASSAKQERELWHLREATEEIYKAHGAAPSFDVSVPLTEVESYIARVRARFGLLDAKLDPYIFGHLADGNMHIVLDCGGPLPPERQQAVEDILYTGLHALGGSFAAEHGVGSKRIGALQATAGAPKLDLMRAMKASIDPKGIMNPGKVLPMTASPPRL
jgi:FAD/FMN-containing dehydrogenase